MMISIAEKISNRISGISNLQSNKTAILNNTVAAGAIALQHLNGVYSYFEAVSMPK